MVGLLGLEPRTVRLFSCALLEGGELNSCQSIISRPLKPLNYLPTMHTKYIYLSHGFFPFKAICCFLMFIYTTVWPVLITYPTSPHLHFKSFNNVDSGYTPIHLWKHLRQISSDTSCGRWSSIFTMLFFKWISFLDWTIPSSYCSEQLLSSKHLLILGIIIASQSIISSL